MTFLKQLFLLLLYCSLCSDIEAQQIGIGGAIGPYGYQSNSRVDNPFEVFGTAATKPQEMCYVGSEVNDDNLNNRNGAYLLLCPSLVSVCDGSVREWIFHSGADDNTAAYLGFFRRASNQTLQLIGYNRVRGTQLGRHSIQIREGNRINVLKNDFVGVFYDNFMTDYSVVAYQRYARTFTAAKNTKLQSCYIMNFTFTDIMTQHGRVQGMDDIYAEPTLISLQAVVDRHPLFSCYAGPDPRSFSTMRSPTWLALMPATSFPCAGRIIRWELLSIAAAIHTISVYLSVWRFATNMTWTSPSTKRQILQRVAYQQVLVDRNGFMVLEGDDLFDIYVQKNDFLGIYFDAPNADSGVPIITDLQTLPEFPDTEAVEEKSIDPSLIEQAPFSFSESETTLSLSTTLASFLNPSTDSGALPKLHPGESLVAGAASVSPKSAPELDWCILSKTYREKIDLAMELGTLTLYDFRIRKCAAAMRAFVKDFTLTDCGMPPNVDHSQQYGNTTYETSRVTYVCNDGYLLVGDPIAVCQSNGLWTEPPDCVESYEKSGISPCFYPPPLANAEAKINTVKKERKTNETDFQFEPLTESVFATYRCKTGFIMVGKPDVECKPPGEWGERPKCEEIKAACKAGKVVQGGGVAEEAHLMAFTKMRFTCSGEIHTWEYFSNSTDGEVVYFDVWRKIDNGHYRLVGSNSFPALNRGRIIQPVEVNDRIRVAAGDFIGIHYVTTKVNPVIPMFNTRNAGELARLLGDTYIVDLNDASLDAQTSSNQGYLDLRRLSRSSLRLPPIIAYANALPGCGLPHEVAHSKYVAKDTNQGSVATYECNKGYAIHGSKDVFCRSPNMWTNPPVCLPIELCRTGPDLHNSTLANAASFLNIFKTMNFPCAGVISEWQFYSLNPEGIVYFGVWRYVSDRSFELVGVNRVVVNGTGLQVWYVKGDERITVLQDYMVGIHYDDPLIAQDRVIVPHADDTRPFPYSNDQLYDGWAFEVGHDDLIKMNGRILLAEKSRGLRKRWRIPAVNPVVRRALVSCGNPPVVANSALMGRETTQYSVRTYKCDSGYFLVGKENITCKVSGRWTEPPLCVNGCIWGKAIPEKEFNTRSQRNTLSIFVSKPLKCRGFVKEWSFFSIVDEPTSFYFDIWRRNGTQQLYLLIGSNRVFSNGYGLQKVEISVEQQIFAEVGDVVGFHYDIMTPPVVAEAEPDDYAYHPNDLYDVLEEMDYGLIHPGTKFLLAPIKIRKAAKLPSMSVKVLNYQSRPYGVCEADTDCPKNAECVARDSRNSVCMCKSGYWLRFDGMSCLPAAGIGEPCDESVACESQVMTCSEEGTCQCIPGWTPSSDGQRCKPVSPNPDFRYSVHGEPCGSDALCYHSFRDQECRDGICQCRRGYRWASDFEHRANPETLEECRPQNTSLHLLPELAELCYIDQRAYYERIRRTPSSNYGVSNSEVTLVQQSVVAGGSGGGSADPRLSYADHQGEVIRAAVISALSMLGACAIMFAVWSWNSQQGIYPLERRVGNLLSSRRSGGSGMETLSGGFSSMRRGVFQRFQNDASHDNSTTDMEPIHVSNPVAKAPGVDLTQCSLNLAEMEEISANLLAVPNRGATVLNVSDATTSTGGKTNSSSAFDQLSFQASGSMKPLSSLRSSNQSLNNQFGEPTPGRSDTLTLLSTSANFLASNNKQTSSNQEEKRSEDAVGNVSIDSTSLLTETAFSSPLF